MWTPPFGDVSKPGPYAMLNVNTPVHLQAEWLARESPGLLHTYPSNAGALARVFAEQDSLRRRLHLQGLLTFAEIVTDEVRSLCRQIFDVELADCYSAHECRYIALQCPAGPRYHVQSEVILVEALDASGRPCAPGELGQVVCTPIYNYAMPLIRYAMNDHVVPGEPCACGRPHPVLKQVLGRTRNLFRLPGGVIIQPDFKPRTIADFLGPRQWQVAQTGPQRIEMRLVPDRSGRPVDYEGMTAYIRRLLELDVTVDYRLMDTIPVGPTGKHEDYICELADG